METLAMGRLASGMKRLAAVAVMVTLPAAVGCGAFFQCEGKTSCSTSSTADTGNIVFAGNAATSSVYAYYVNGSDGLTSVAGSPFTATSAPVSMAVTPDNSLLYVAETNGVYSYAVSSAGVLSNATSQPSSSVVETSIAISPDGQWLLALDIASSSSIAPALRVYQILSGGTLKSAGTGIASLTGYPTGTAVTTYNVAISADGAYIAASLGAGGDIVASFNTSSGTIGNLTAISAQSGSDNTVAFDSKDNLYIGRTAIGTSGSGIVVYSVTGTGAPVVTQLSPSTPYVTGSGPRALAFASSSSLLYSANYSAGTITANSVTQANASTSQAFTVTAIGSDISAPQSVNRLAVDSTGKYLAAAGVSATAGLQFYKIGTSGSLTSEGTIALGTTNSVPALAVTH